MKVKCIKKTEKTYISNSYQVYFGDIIFGDIYDVVSIEKDWYRIIDASGEEYLYPPELFEVIKN